MAVAESAPGTTDTFGIPPGVYQRRWVILATLCISLVAIVLAVSSLNVAIPSIQQELGASGTELQWIIDSYALVFAGMLLPAGALGDRFGRKGTLQFGLVVFGLAALAASAADDPTQLIVARTAMGVGAAFIMPSTLSIIVNSFPFHERGKAIAVWAAFAGLGGALGPLSSGLLLEHYWWGSVFFANVPLIALLLLLSIPIIPTSKDPDGRPLDPIGALLAVAGLVALVYGVIEAPDNGWTDPITIGALVGSAALLYAFVRWELRKRHPMLDPRLFRLPGFAAGSAAVTVAFFSVFGMFFLLTQYLQFVKGYSPLEAGVRVLPNAIALMIVAPQAPKIVVRFGVRRTMRVGFFLTATGFLLFASAQASTPIAVITIALLCNGTGMALVMPAASQHIVGSLPLSKAGVGSAVNDVTREVGGAIGIAVGGSIVATVYRGASFLGTIPEEPREAAQESIGQTIGVASAALRDGFIDRATFDAVIASAGEAFNDGTRVAFMLMAFVAIVGGILITRVIPDQMPTSQVPH